MKRFLLSLLLTASAAASPISDRAAALQNFLGPAITQEADGADGGRVQHFQNGSLFWHPETGARLVHGLIRNRYKALGYEKGALGYPITDEIDLVDGSGKVSKFKGGQLMWRWGATTVEELRSTALVVDWPFPVGEAWVVGQTNSANDAKDSHIGPFAYCWDINLANGTTGGKPFVAAATSRIVFVEQGLNSGGGNAGNVVVQRLGEGRYASYLHIGKNSYSTQFAKGPGILFLPQTVGWSGRPLPKSGTPLGEAGDTGTGVGNHHMHFCVTTTPDRAEYGPFESVPVAFRNYSVSKDQGKTWTFVAQGVPRSGQWVRREASTSQGLPKVEAATSPLSYGKVIGRVAKGDGKPTGAGKLRITLLSAWGEPLRTTTVNVPANNLAGPWSFQFPKVPAYRKLKIAVTYEGPWNQDSDRVNGESVTFDLAPNGVAMPAAIALKTTLIH